MKTVYIFLAIFLVSNIPCFADEIKINIDNSPNQNRQISPQNKPDSAQKLQINKILGLSQIQVQQAEAIRFKGFNEMKPLMERQKIKMNELKTAPPEKQAEIKNELKAIHQAVIKAQTGYENEFIQILTPEQKVKYIEFKENNKQQEKNLPVRQVKY